MTDAPPPAFCGKCGAESHPEACREAVCPDCVFKVMGATLRLYLCEEHEGLQFIQRGSP